MSLLTNFRETLAKRQAYRNTVAEIEALPLNVAIDLEIFTEDARKIARKAVYGG